MQRIRYGFKASALDLKQIKNRLKLSRALHLKDFVCELYLDGIDIWDSGVRKKIINNSSCFNGIFSLHIPVVDHRNVFYDSKRITIDYIDYLAEVADKLNKAAIILHRCWGFGSDIKWDEASRNYKDWLWRISSKHPSLTFLVENFGLVFRKNKGKLQIYMSPLDHFFPREIDNFDVWLKKNNITNIHPLVDFAHLNQTLNLLKAWRMDPDKVRHFFHKSLHHRIDNRTFYFERLEDCISKKVYPYFHISDSCCLPKGARCQEWQSYFVSEGLVMGKGDIKWRQLLKKIMGLFDAATFIMEVNMQEPENGVEQKDSIQFARKLIRSIH